MFTLSARMNLFFFAQSPLRQPQPTATAANVRKTKNQTAQTPEQEMINYPYDLERGISAPLHTRVDHNQIENNS